MWYDDKGMTTYVGKYSGDSDMRRDVKKAGENGWVVVSTSSVTRRPLWHMILPFWWILGTSGYVATFQRQQTPQ